MYVFVRPHATQPADERLLHCLDEISRCQSQSFKDTVHAQRLTQLSNSPITFCGQQIIPATSVRNLHVNVDSSLSFRTHVNRVVSICLHQLRRIKSSLKALPQETTKFLVNCFMVSRLAIACLPAYLNHSQSTTACHECSQCSVGRRAHVSDLLGNGLHLLLTPSVGSIRLTILPSLMISSNQA